ncbi:MAG: MATE family efflux transporter [Gemmatimonadaceae bacterium]|nr:MATE family efflux transporter [Gemmatimonadaceae bacterium]NUO93801.1 MATE family efflux transporter [Gemmatimonadaceae bacterium]NUS32603.1 MATE family efflux transporter [Gemmatimonadaceae bacterium]
MSSNREAVLGSPTPTPSVWAAIRESLAGAHGRDFTEGAVGRSIFILAVPMVLEMVMESVFAVVDVFVVAHLGAEAVATVGLTESLMTILYAIAFGLSIGAGAMVARRIGEKNPEAAAHTAAQVILFGAMMSLLLGILGVGFAPQLLRVMGGSADVLTHVSFTRIMLGGNITVVMLFLLNATLRSSGDAAAAMRVLWLANAINIVLCPTLVLGLGPVPALGIKGAAIATTIGRSIGAVFALSRLFKPGSRVELHARHFAFDPALIVRVIRLSSAATIQVFIGMASWIGLVRILAGFGSAALAGYTIGIRIVIFALLPSAGLANAAATMVGQALGARKPARAEQVVWTAGRYGMWFLGTVGAAFVLLAPSIVAIFTSDPAVATYATRTLRTIALGFPFYAYGMVFTQSFNGAGDTRTPTYINLFVFWLFEIPLAWLLAGPLDFGPQGVFTAATVAFCTLAVVSALLFRRGRWKALHV